MQRRVRRDGVSARLRRVLKRVRRDEAGQALIEAALVFTVLPFIFLGVSEFSEADLVKRRVDEAAGVSADLIARLASVSRAEINGMKDNLINEMIKPFPGETFGLVVTSVTTDASGRSLVAWSHARGGSSVARTPGTSITLPAGIDERSTSVVLAETSYGFRSTLASLITSQVQMRGVAYSAPRQAGPVQILP